MIYLIFLVSKYIVLHVIIFCCFFASQCGSVAETVAYDVVLETAMKVQGFQQRNLLLHGPWKWLLTQFASYYGVSEIYTKLR